MATVELPDWAHALWHPVRYVGLYGGRGGAKSRSIARAYVIQASSEHHRVLCGREVQKSIKDSVKRLLDDEIARCELKGFISTETEIRGPNESLFSFTGLRGNAANVKSYEGYTDFWGEEAQTISQASLDTIIPTIRAPNSKLTFSWNPDLPTDPVDAMFRGDNGPPPNSVVLEVNHEDNPWFPDVLRAEMEYCRSRDIDKYNHIWRGGYRMNSEARIFRNWRIEEFDSPSNVEYRLGADFGFSVDPSCLVRCWIDGTKMYIDYEAWGLNVEINNLPQLFMAVPDAEKWWITADSSRPETISYLRNHGFPRIRAAIKGPRSVEEGIEFIKSYDVIVHPRCVKTIEELMHYSYKTDPLTGEVLPIIEDKDNHCIDSLRYACEGARRALVKPRHEDFAMPSFVTPFARR